ncbi:hypothetical protein HW571_27210 [Agrobacterium genomosp. 3]|nr:hypothetical protein [Agrobacterium tomkonis]MCA1879668.1 hypothetical protein [Agrobacterium tumefaciens]MCA1894877.1 hypothetical protein [Agrobacterium tomkonis]
MPADVIRHECRDEKVRVIVSFAQVERERDVRLVTSGFEQLRAQARFEKRIGGWRRLNLT